MTGVYRKWGRVIRFENGTTIRVDEAGEATETKRGVSPAPTVGPNCVGRARRRSPAGEVRPSAQPVRSRMSPRRSIACNDRTPHHQLRRCPTRGERLHGRRNRNVYTSRSSTRAPCADRSGVVLTWPSSARLLTRWHVQATSERHRCASGLRQMSPPRCCRRSSASWRWSRGAAAFRRQGPKNRNAPVTFDPPPNWYRPGYAVRPVRAWLNIRALPFGSIDGSAPLAVALLAPVEGTILRVLCIDGRRCLPAMLDANRIAAVSPTSRCGTHTQQVRSASR